MQLSGRSPHTIFSLLQFGIRPIKKTEPSQCGGGSLLRKEQDGGPTPQYKVFLPILQSQVFPLIHQSKVYLPTSKLDRVAPLIRDTSPTSFTTLKK